MDRLQTWIDLNTPYYGNWADNVGNEKVEAVRKRRADLMARYGNRHEDEERIGSPVPEEAATPVSGSEPGKKVSCAQVSVQSVEVTPALLSAGTLRSITLPRDGGKLEFVRIPAGRLVIDSLDGSPDEGPAGEVSIEREFWMSAFEISNAQYAIFDPDHDSRLEHSDAQHFSAVNRGYPLNHPTQPVCRVSWTDAVRFCSWLSEATGLDIRLPTEAQWEWACRAGTSSAHWYGEDGTRFSEFANLADICLHTADSKRPEFLNGLVAGDKISVRFVPPFRPAVLDQDDKYRVSSPVGTYRPNPWGLYDMHGNVAEWTRSLYQPYPCTGDTAMNDLSAKGKRVVRGGSWYDRPKRATAYYRWGYEPWLAVFDVGFRVVIEVPVDAAERAARWRRFVGE
jgi:formylglycine-generating enzyme required for sulfatase activity